MSDSQEPTATPGWYPDGTGGQRYWDGSNWTENRAPAAAAPTKKGVPVWAWFIIVPVLGFTGLCLLGLFGIGSAFNDAVDDTPSSSTKAQSARIREQVDLEGTRYVVQSATTADNVGGEYGETADGQFVVIELTIENLKNESKTFSDEAAKIIGGNGKKYSTDSDAGVHADNPLIFEQMDPDNPTTGTLVFDLPPESVAGSKLELSDLWGGGSVLVDLELK